MARPTLEDSRDFLTLPEVAVRLEMNPNTLRRWIKRGLLPSPTVTKRDGVRLFSQEWLARAKKVRKEAHG